MFDVVLRSETEYCVVLHPSGRSFGFKPLCRRPAWEKSCVCNGETSYVRRKISWLAQVARVLVSVTFYPTLFLSFDLSFILSHFLFAFLLVVSAHHVSESLMSSYLEFRISRYLSVDFSSLSGLGLVVVWLTHVGRSDERSPAAMAFLQWWHLQLHLLYSPFFTTRFYVTVISVNHDCANPFVLAQSLMWRILHGYIDIYIQES